MELLFDNNFKDNLLIVHKNSNFDIYCHCIYDKKKTFNSVLTL